MGIKFNFVFSDTKSKEEYPTSLQKTTNLSNLLYVPKGIDLIAISPETRVLY